MLGWLVASAPWIVGGVVGGTRRLVWWAIAAVLDMTGTWLAHPIPGRVLRSENIEFDATHLLQRCRLFLLIALGEVVVTTAPPLLRYRAGRWPF
jgi:low temperature requirement protein LtrA